MSRDLFVLDAVVAASPQEMRRAIAPGISVARGRGGAILLVGLSTSLPDFVACLAAIGLGSTNPVVGNRSGSNAFNLA